MERLRMAALALGLVVSMADAGHALDVVPTDEAEIQSCIEGVRDYNAGATAEEQASRDECIGRVATPCLETDGGQSTLGMTECYGRELAVWDTILNDSYAALKTSLSGEAFEALRDTQLKWIAYRDAKCEWPAVFFGGGTLARPVAAACLSETTARRANELADYLEWAQN